MRAHHVRALLMGGQACVFYGAAEFSRASAAHVRFWLLELRTPEILIEVAGNHARVCRRLAAKRPLLVHADRGGDVSALERALFAEESAERLLDRQYWSPLRAELETLRRAR
jgi:hypothetical protein